ncbi:hypothetical protein PCANC_25838 [Puccinia coronata f. sp. avenae]|uniref:DASH complex subunit ASK1 n=1 Tax=Puccinia coronata f. sp. avenae TaxID=200324 RepID=A0A2N5TUK2_9BASI|nr:hypothetical protein PCANC_25838 [Puccinia coronata f. sp. avenae]
MGRGGKILLHQALLRATMSGTHKRQTISTPAKSRSRRGSGLTNMPPEVADPDWDGIADLGKMPLNAFAGSSKNPSRHARLSGDHKGLLGPAGNSFQSDPEESLQDGISPPQTIHFSVPRSKLAQTPSKEAARLVTRDVLEMARLHAGSQSPLGPSDAGPSHEPLTIKPSRAGQQFSGRSGPSQRGPQLGSTRHMMDDTLEAAGLAHLIWYPPRHKQTPAPPSAPPSQPCLLSPPGLTTLD